MNQSKKLVVWIGGMFGVAILMTAMVMAYDRRDQIGVIDHLFDFHLDLDKVREDVDRHNHDRAVERERQSVRDRNYKKFCDEVTSLWDGGGSNQRENSGTVGPPDRDN